MAEGPVCLASTAEQTLAAWPHKWAPPASLTCGSAAAHCLEPHKLLAAGNAAPAAGKPCLRHHQVKLFWHQLPQLRAQPRHKRASPSAPLAGGSCLFRAAAPKHSFVWKQPRQPSVNTGIQELFPAAADSPPWLLDVPVPAALRGVLKVLAASFMAPSSPQGHLDTFWARARHPALFPAKAPRQVTACSACRDQAVRGEVGSCLHPALLALGIRGPALAREERRAKSSSRCSLDSLIPAGPFQLSCSLTPCSLPAVAMLAARQGAAGQRGRLLRHPPLLRRLSAGSRGCGRCPRPSARCQRCSQRPGGLPARGRGGALVPRWAPQQPGPRGARGPAPTGRRGSRPPVPRPRAGPPRRCRVLGP